MTEAATERARFNMVEQQIRTWDVFDNRVLDVFRELPREHFAPSPYQSLAYADTQIPLGHGHVMEEPKTQARLLQALNVEPHDRILDVGTGSGFLAACLSKLGGLVHTVDIHREFVEKARERIRGLGLSRITLEVSDLGRGLGDLDQHYDVIAITGALPVMHKGFHRALRLGGRMFVVTGTAPVMEALLITRVDVARWASQSLFDTYLPALENTETLPGFVF